MVFLTDHLKSLTKIQIYFQIISINKMKKKISKPTMSKFFSFLYNKSGFFGNNYN